MHSCNLCVEPSALVCMVFVDSLAILTSLNIVNVFVFCPWLTVDVFFVGLPTLISLLRGILSSQEMHTFLLDTHIPKNFQMLSVNQCAFAGCALQLSGF